MEKTRSKGAALARRHGHDVAVFDVKEIMFRIAADRGQPVEEETILDAAGSTLEALRAAALEQVLRLADTRPPISSSLPTRSSAGAMRSSRALMCIT